VVTETRSFRSASSPDCDPTHVEDLEWVETTEIQVRVEFDEGLIWVRATAVPASARAEPMSDVAL